MSVSEDSSQLDQQTRAAGEQCGLGIGALVCGIAAIPAAIHFAFLGIGLAVTQTYQAP